MEADDNQQPGVNATDAMAAALSVVDFFSWPSTKSITNTSAEECRRDDGGDGSCEPTGSFNNDYNDYDAGLPSSSFSSYESFYWWVESAFHSWWFDPMIASVSFAFAVHVYWAQERKRNLSRFVALRECATLGPASKSLLFYWIGIFFWKAIVPPLESIPDGLPVDVTSTAFLLAEVVSGIFLYDFIFFFIHWAMHELPPLRRFHATHHSGPAVDGTVEARDALRNSGVDGTAQVLVNVYVQRYNRLFWEHWALRPKSRMARVVHNVVVTWMLVESHTASPTPRVFRRWCKGVREHRGHHQREWRKEGTDGFRTRYQQFFGYLDDSRDWYAEWKRRLKSHR